MDIREQIKGALMHANMTQRELCGKIGCSYASLNNRMKNGKFTRKELEEIATAMGADFIYKIKFPDGKEY